MILYKVYKVLRDETLNLLLAEATELFKDGNSDVEIYKLIFDLIWNDYSDEVISYFENNLINYIEHDEKILIDELTKEIVEFTLGVEI